MASIMQPSELEKIQTPMIYIQVQKLNIQKLKPRTIYLGISIYLLQNLNHD